MNNLFRIKWCLFLLVFCSFVVGPVYGNIIKLDLDGESNCNGQLDVEIYIKASNVSPDNNPIGIGSSSIFLNYNKDVVTYNTYTSAEFSANTSGQAAGANWIDQDLNANNTYGLMNIVLQKEPGGANDYMLDKNTWVLIGTITFDWVGAESDPGIRVHDKFTMFNVPVNDGMQERVLEDYPSVTDWDNCNTYCLTGNNAPTVSGITSTAASCASAAGSDGSMVISFPDHPSRTGIEFSIDGGATFPYWSPDNAGSITITGLYGGLYEIFCRWGDDSCPFEVQDVAVGVNLAPSVSSIVHHNTCANSTNGTITLAFPDVTTRTNITFSIDGGLTYPYNSPDNVGTYVITGLAAGTYDIWTRWGAGDCPIDLPDKTINTDALVSATSARANSCYNDGSITLTFPDHVSRTTIDFSIDGGTTYPHVIADNVGTYTINNLVPGTYDIWARWGDNDCPVSISSEVITQWDLPIATSAFEAPCANDPGTGEITFSFQDSPQRTGIEFSIDGGATFPHTSGDNAGTLTLTGIPSGTYDLWVRWGNTDCPTDMPDVTVGTEALPTGTASRVHSCYDDGRITITFPDDPNQTDIDFSIDGGVTYPYTSADNAGTFVVNGLVPGTYDIWARWGDDDCPTFLETETIVQYDLPQVTTAISGFVCDNDPSGTATLTFTFADSPQRSAIEFSLDGGSTFPHYILDSMGTMDVTISPGTYDLWVRWGNNQCPVDLPDVTLGLTDSPVVNNVSTIGACNNDGAIVVSFPDHPTRSGIEFSIDGGATFPHWSLDNAGSLTIGNLASGAYDLWVRWGDNSCPVNLPLITVGTGGGAIVSNIRLKAALEGAMAGGTHLMEDDLRVLNLIPTSEPYTALGYTHVNANPGISIPNPAAVFAVTGANAIVDWVFVKIHDADNPALIMEARPALIQRDGDLVEVDGVTLFEVNNFIMCSSAISLFHRNHLGIQTQKGGVQFSLNAGINTLDFTDPSTTLVGIDPAKIVGSIRSIWAGDATNDASISAPDRSKIWNERNFTGYNQSDINLDGVTNASDRSIDWNNRNKTGISPF